MILICLINLLSSHYTRSIQPQILVNIAWTCMFISSMDNIPYHTILEYSTKLHINIHKH